MQKLRIVTPRFGTGRQKLVLERWTNPKLPRRTCTCEHGLQSCRGNRRASRNGRVSDLPPETPPAYGSQLLHLCTPLSLSLSLSLSRTCVAERERKLAYSMHEHSRWMPRSSRMSACVHWLAAPLSCRSAHSAGSITPRTCASRSVAAAQRAWRGTTSPTTSSPDALCAPS
jgi:hypothetical protein